MFQWTWSSKTRKRSKYMYIPTLHSHMHCYTCIYMRMHAQAYHELRPLARTHTHTHTHTHALLYMYACTGTVVCINNRSTRPPPLTHKLHYPHQMTTPNLLIWTQCLPTWGFQIVRDNECPKSVIIFLTSNAAQATGCLPDPSKHLTRMPVKL